MVTVFVVDDQPLMRAGLVALLTAAPGLTVAGEAACGDEAVRLVAEADPDVVVMDIRLPGMDGITATRHILADEHRSPRVLMLTTFDLDRYVYEALSAGASGFILKDAAPERLLAAIHTVAGGDMLFAPTITRKLIETYLDHAGSGHNAERVNVHLDVLTARERDVLQLVGTGASNTEIAGRLFITEGTVKTHLNRVMTKLSLVSRAQAVVTAYETGLVTADPPGRQSSPGGHLADR